MEKQLFASFERVRAVRNSRILIVVILMALGVNAYSDPTSPEVSWERIGAPTESVRVGDDIHLKLSGVDFKEIDLPESLTEDGWTLRKEPNGDWVATPLKAGKLTLPSMILKDAEGKEVGKTSVWMQEVLSVIQPSDPKPEEPNGLEPPVGLQFPWLFLVLGGFLILALIAGLGYAVYRWRKRNKPLPKPAPEVYRPEDEVALENLKILENQNLLKTFQFKEYYFGISEILKAYLGLRYRFDAPESTTREMIEALEQKMAMNAALIDRVEILFNKMDRVKFTDHVPDLNEAARLMAEARELIFSTRRPPSVMAPSTAPTKGVTHEVR